MSSFHLFSQSVLVFKMNHEKQDSCMCMCIILKNCICYLFQDLPQLIEGRIDYFEPSFEAMIQSGVSRLKFITNPGDFYATKSQARWRHQENVHYLSTSRRENVSKVIRGDTDCEIICNPASKSEFRNVQN